MKVITYSRRFPSYHPRKNESTYFVEKIWNVKIDECGVWSIGLPGAQDYYTTDEQAELIAKNDGLSEIDLHFWLNKIPFDGQIICHNENIEY